MFQLGLLLPMEVVPIHGDFEVDCDWLGNSDQWQLAIHDDNSVTTADRYTCYTLFFPARYAFRSPFYPITPVKYALRFSPCPIIALPLYRFSHSSRIPAFRSIRTCQLPFR